MSGDLGLRFGPDFVQALAGLGKTLEGQYEELLGRGNDELVKPNPDPEWVRAYKEHKHPAIDRIKVLFCGRAMFSIAIVSGKAKADVPSILDLEPSLLESTLQPA